MSTIPRWLMPVIIATVAVALVAGFVILTLDGRDTSSYVLFLASPLVTSVVGGLLVANVKQVAAAVGSVRQELPIAVRAMAKHLSAQGDPPVTPAEKSD